MEEDYYGINGLLDMASTQYKLSSLAGGASAFAQLAGGMLDYGTLRTNAAALKANANALKVQANDIELQAKQRANYLREQFIGAIGSYQFSAANRGVSVGSGSVQQNIESSAIGVGKDIQKAQKVAQMKASALRAQSDIAMLQSKVAKSKAKTAKVTGILGAIGSIAGAVGNYYTGSQLDLPDISTGKGSYDPSKTAPSKKPF